MKLYIFLLLFFILEMPFSGYYEYASCKSLIFLSSKRIVTAVGVMQNCQVNNNI